MGQNMQQIWRGATVFDGQNLRDGFAVAATDGLVTGVVPEHELGTMDLSQAQVTELKGGILAPGLLDIQVNGGGGHLLGQGAPDAELAAICSAHLALGSTGVLPTLITSDRDTIADVLDAARRAQANTMPGFVGVHLEGPFLDPACKGAHDAALIRPMEDADLALLIAAARDLKTLMVTLAPHSASEDQIAALAVAGVVVSLGHSACSDAQAMTCFAAGALGVTHLFNAMSPLSHRAPGLVGAALDLPVWAGIIPDGVHVSARAFRIAHRAKPGRLIAVSDAMAVAGTDLDRFTLNDREILRANGRLTLADGTLAGADTSLPQALRWMVQEVGVSLSEGLAMMTRAPAEMLGLTDRGQISSGARADLVHFDADLSLQAVWVAGQANAITQG